MRKLMIVLCAIALATSASAQVTWNIKGGLGVTNVKANEDFGGSYTSHFAGRIGVGMEKPLGENLSLMPSLELAWKGFGYEFSEKYTSYLLEQNIKCDIYYLQMPILLAYRLNLSGQANMVIKAGPYFAYGLYGNLNIKQKEEDFNGSPYNFEEDFDVFGSELKGKRFDAGLDLGLDIELQRFVLGVEYELGLTDVINHKDENWSLSMKNQAFYVTVGYKF